MDIYLGKKNAQNLFCKTPCPRNSYISFYMSNEVKFNVNTKSMLHKDGVTHKFYKANGTNVFTSNDTSPVTKFTFE